MKVWYLLFYVGVSVSAASVFSLSDSDPDSPEFKKRFLASYGVHGAIEPKLASKDQALYKKVLPLLSSAPRDAIAIVQREVNPNSNAAFDFLVGNLFYQLRDFGQAERAMKEAVRKFPSFRRAHRTLALIYVQRDELERAIEPLLRVIELGGGDGQSYGLLGYAYLVGEKYESGLAAYRMARMFKPDSLDFRRGQAHCLLETDQNKLAIALFDELIVEFPSETDFWLLQANAFLAAGEKGKAIANLELVGDRKQGNWSTYILLGDLYLSDDLVQLALASYLRALDQDPASDGELLIRPLKALVERRHFAIGKRYLVAMRTVANSNISSAQQTEIDLAEAKIEAKIGDPTLALSLLKKSLSTDPLNGEVLLTLGDHYFGTEMFDEAERYYELALSVPEVKGEALVSLGRLAVSRGTFSTAVSLLRQAQEIHPRPNVARYLEAVERRVKTR
jgi:tetratricopeptide (TPR) repeat protein